MEQVNSYKSSIGTLTYISIELVISAIFITQTLNKEYQDEYEGNGK